MGQVYCQDRKQVVMNFSRVRMVSGILRNMHERSRELSFFTGRGAVCFGGGPEFFGVVEGGTSFFQWVKGGQNFFRVTAPGRGLHVKTDRGASTIF